MTNERKEVSAMRLRRVTRNLRKETNVFGLTGSSSGFRLPSTLTALHRYGSNQAPHRFLSVSPKNNTITQREQLRRSPLGR